MMMKKCTYAPHSRDSSTAEAENAKIHLARQPNSRDQDQLTTRFWGMIEEHVYQTPICDTIDLKHHFSGAEHASHRVLSMKLLIAEDMAMCMQSRQKIVILNIYYNQPALWELSDCSAWSFQS